jgi:hypothetical protein
MEGEAGKENNYLYKAASISDSGNYYGFKCLNIGSYKGFYGLYTRKDLLDKWGLDIPQTIDDWTKLFEVAKENGVKYPLTGDKEVVGFIYKDLFNTAWGVGTGFYVDGNKVKFGPFEKGYKEFKSRFEVLKAGKSINAKDKNVAALIDHYDSASEKRKQLISLATKYKGKDKDLCDQAHLDLKQVVEEKMHVGQFLINIVNSIYTFKDENSKKFWTRTFCEAASEIEDCSGLLAVLKDPSLEIAYTATRKALRVIDFINYGPTIA